MFNKKFLKRFSDVVLSATLVSIVGGTSAFAGEEAEIGTNNLTVKNMLEF